MLKLRQQMLTSLNCHCGYLSIPMFQCLSMPTLLYRATTLTVTLTLLCRHWLVSSVCLFQSNQLRHRFSVMEDGERQQAPPLPPRTSFERTITVVRGNRSLGMLSVFLMVMVSWCVYVAGMTIITLIGGGGDDDCPEEEWWSDVLLVPERGISECVWTVKCVCLGWGASKGVDEQLKSRERIWRSNNQWVYINSTI